MSYTPRTANSKDGMVMRTVRLPLEMDRKLREIAFHEGVPQSEIMTRMVSDGLRVMGSCLYPPADLEEKRRA